MVKRLILGVWLICGTVGVVVHNLNITQADQPGTMVMRPASIETVAFQPVLTDLDVPILVTNAGDLSNRLFVVELRGKIKVAQTGASTATVFLDLSSTILTNEGEQGLLGLAFHPQYRTNGRFFVYYTKPPDGSLQLSEFHVSAANPNVANPTEIPLLNIPHPFNANHNGGMLAFGPDGYLYLGPGDGGNGNDPPNNAQNINSLLGKILRLDVDHPNGSIPYSSPASNPFFGATPGADEIWMTGMRNPWRFSFDRADPNKLWIGDVGQGAREEIDRVDLTQDPASGARNGGWRIFEGVNCTGLDPCVPLPANYVPPVADYAHIGGRCSITGGYVYRGSRGTFPTGTYIYA
ncbi:MAG: PQQ-dependent sugar dehydrogenase, partial [Pyrinomonadaceae bacterium]